MTYDLKLRDGKTVVSGTPRQIIEHILRTHMVEKTYDEETSNERMKHIGQNGNTGEHYSDPQTGIHY